MIYPENFIYLLKLERGTIFKVGLHLIKQMNVVLTTLNNITVVIFFNLFFLTLNTKNKCYKLIHIETSNEFTVVRFIRHPFFCHRQVYYTSLHKIVGLLTMNLHVYYSYIEF